MTSRPPSLRVERRAGRLSVLCLFTIGPIPRSALKPGTPWQQMIDGLVYVRRNRLVLGAITLDLFAVLLGGVTAMLPLYARDILHVGADGLGPLRAAPALGATLTAIFFSVRPLHTNVGVKMLTAVVVFGAATAVFGISKSYFLSLAMLALLGAADMFSVYIRQSLIQRDATHARQGIAASTLAFLRRTNSAKPAADSPPLGSAPSPPRRLGVVAIVRYLAFGPLVPRTSPRPQLRIDEPPHERHPRGCGSLTACTPSRPR